MTTPSRPAPLAPRLATARWVLVAVACAGGLAVPSSGAAARVRRAPVYRDPPAYKGTTVAPKVTIPAPKPPPPTTLSSVGTNPDVVVDEAGTAHVVWNEDRGDGADVVVYCRIKRGGSGCDARTDLRSEIPDTSPDAKFDAGGPPKIVRLGDQLIVFSFRYPVVRDKPDGGSSETVIAWSSGDGGTSWTPTPSTVGRSRLGQLIVIGSEDDPTVLNLGEDPLCPGGSAGLCIEAYKSGQYTSQTGNLSTAKDQNYNVNLVRDEHGMPVLSAEDLNYDTIIRRWTGVGSPLDSATWTAPTTLPGDQTSLAGGPAGVYLMSKPKTGYGPYAVQQLRADGATYTPGPATIISPKLDNVLGRLTEGPDGRLLAAWQQRGKGLTLATTPGAAGTKPAFAPSTVIAPGGDNGQIALGASADGGGFTAFNHTGGIVNPGQIQIAGFGTQTPTGKPGIADLPGGGATPGGAGTGGSCRELGFGSFTVEAVEGCLYKGGGSRSADYVTSGELNFWGVRIVPDAGVKIVLDPRKLQLDTTGSVKVVLRAPAPIGDVVLFHGSLHRDLSKVTPGTSLFDFPAGLSTPSLLGFDIPGRIDVRLEKDGVHVPVDLQLPPAFGNFSGHAELVADKVRGLHVDSVHIHLGPVPLGALVVNSVDLDYRGGDDVWSGAGSVTVPAGGRLDLSAEFRMGQFKGAAFRFAPTTPVPIGPFVYLLRFGGGFHTDPVVINANATLGVGAAVNGESPAKVDGDLTMTFPANGPADFKLKGTVALFFLEVGQGYLDFQTDGYAAFGGHTGLTIGPLSLNANMDGFVDATTGDYGASIDGEVKLCVDVKLETICGKAGSSVAVNTHGFAMCTEILGESAGVEYPWAEFHAAEFLNPISATLAIVDHIAIPCSTAAYHTPPPRPVTRAAQAAAADGGTAITVEPGLPSKTILVQGTDGPPRVTVSGPGGSVSTEQANGVGVAMTPKGVNAAYVVLHHPKPGTWTVVPEAGSPAITAVKVSEGFVPATVRARLGGKGRRRTISYAVEHLDHGQSVQFLERGAFGTHILGTVTKARGTLTFAPADVKGGARQVVAVVQQDGLPSSRTKVGTYVAPGPLRPAAVRGLQARRQGDAVVVRWRPLPGVRTYAVTLRGAGGTRLGRLVTGGRRATTIPGVRREEAVVVKVTGLSAKLRMGAARTVRLPGRR